MFFINYTLIIISSRRTVLPNNVVPTVPQENKYIKKYKVKYSIHSRTR